MLCIGRLVHHVGGRVAQHALDADIEDLMTPFASVAMLEKLALLRIAFCKAPVLSKASWRRISVMLSRRASGGVGEWLDCGFLDMVEFRVKHEDQAGFIWRGVSACTTPETVRPAASSARRGMASMVVTRASRAPALPLVAPLSGPAPAVVAQRAHAVRERVLAHLLRPRCDLWDQPAQVVVDRQYFVNAGAAAITGSLVARRAALCP